MELLKIIMCGCDKTIHVKANSVGAMPMSSNAPCSVRVEEAMAASTRCDPFNATTKLFLNPLELIVFIILHSATIFKLPVCFVYPQR